MRTICYGAVCALTTSIAFPTTVAANSAITCGETYTIVRGDSLSEISARAYGSVDFAALHEHNLSVVGANPNLIYIGQQIEIPCRDAAVEAVVVQASLNTETSVSTATSGRQAFNRDADGNLILTFNKASAPKFVINAGIIDIYLDDIARVTEGRVTFVDPETMNRDHSAQYDLVTSGEVDATYVLNSTIAEEHPLLQLPMVPLFGGSAEQTAVALWKLHQTYMADTNYFDDAQLMGFVSAPAAHIWRDTDAPVLPSENVLEANAYPVPYFEGLDVRGPAAVREEVKGLIASLEAEASVEPTYFLAHGAARAVGIWTDEITVTEVDYGVYTPTFSVVISNEAWAQISPEDQASILDVSGEFLSHRSASWDAFDNGFRSDMLANGLKFEKASQAVIESLQKQSKDDLQTWMMAADDAGIPTTEAINFYLAQLRQLDDRLIYRAGGGS